MATVSEVKAVAAEAKVKAGEGWQALDAAKEQIVAASMVTEEAHQMIAMAFDGHNKPSAEAAIGFFSKAYASIHHVLVMLEEAQTELIAGQNLCDEYMGSL